MREARLSVTKGKHQTKVREKVKNGCGELNSAFAFYLEPDLPQHFIYCPNGALYREILIYLTEQAAEIL